MIGRLARFWRPPDGGEKIDTPFANADDATEDPILLGEEAQRIIDSPVMAIALGQVEKKLLNTIKGTALGEIEKREEAYRLYWAAQALKTELLTIAGNGKMRAAERARRAA